MFRRSAIIYFAVIGWFCVLVAISVPIVLMCLDTDHPIWLLPAAWLTAAVVSLASGTFILWGKRNKYLKVGVFFVVVGLGSLAGVFGAYLKFGYDFVPTQGPSPVGNTDNTGASSN